MGLFGSRSGPLRLEKLVWLLRGGLPSAPAFTLSRAFPGRRNCKAGVPRGAPARVTRPDSACARRRAESILLGDETSKWPSEIESHPEEELKCVEFRD